MHNDSDSRPILVTGAGGQLGAHVLHSAQARGIPAVGLTRAQLDITNDDDVAAALTTHQPRAVINCAAYTNVDGAETDRDSAFRVNEAGSRVLARQCREHEVHLVAVSTDYVFPGTNETGYAETDATGPINVYGESKLAGEQAIREEMGERACIARTAWLFSSQPPNFVQTIVRLARERDTLDVVADQRGNPTWCGHLADALLDCALQPVHGTVHLVDTPEATWYELARDVVKVMGSDAQVNTTTSDAYPRPARRAAVSVLRVTRDDTPPMGDWRRGLDAALSDGALS